MTQQTPAKRLTFQEQLNAVIKPDGSLGQLPGGLMCDQFPMVVPAAHANAHNGQLQHKDDSLAAWADGVDSPHAPVSNTISESRGRSQPATGSCARLPLGVAPYIAKHCSRIKSARRREQCRLNQARYRKRQSERDAELREAVEDLRREIAELIAQRQRLCDPRIITIRTTPWYTLARLFDLLRCGLTNAGGENRLSQRPSRAQQVEFITSVVDEHVRLGEARGRQALLDQLDRFSTFFSDLLLVLRHVQEVHADQSTKTLHLSIRLELTITADTIQHVFPQLLLLKNREVQHKLVGQRLVCDVHGMMVFDAEDHIVDVSWTTNFACALGRVLTIRETAEVLQHARIERDAFLQVPTPVYSQSLPAKSSRGRHWYLSGSHFAVDRQES